ncbi:MAG: type 4a pilus biogenesis protein PilO [Desulfobulbaceae bacterium]|nr:type 4a pilus biogenesis protein PilO [Desulfobulbaceae bacterium]
MDTKEIRAAFDSFLDSKVVPLPNNIKAAIVAATILVPAVLFYFLYFSPKNQEIAGLERSVATMQQELNTIKAKAAKLDEQNALMAETEAKFKEAAIVIPDTKEIPSLLSNISSKGSNAGLDILSFVPGAETAKEFYAEIPVSLSVTGTYHNVGYFLDTVSKLPRIVNVGKVSLSGPKLTDGELLINAKLDLVTYKFIEPSNAATGTQAKK